MENIPPTTEGLVPATPHQEGEVPTVQHMNVGEYFETADTEVVSKVHSWWDTIKEDIKHFELRVENTVDGIVRFSKHFVEGFELKAHHDVADVKTDVTNLEKEVTNDADKIKETGGNLAK